MYCEDCGPSYSVQTTVKITKEGHEIVVEYCGHCLKKTETEYKYIKGPTTAFRKEKE